jgi:hypothetical protein
MILPFLLLPFLLLPFAAQGFSFSEYSTGFTVANDMSTGTLGRSNEVSRFASQGRASVVVRTGGTYFTRSYSLFNSTVHLDLSQTGVDQCQGIYFDQSLDGVFDLSSSGWLSKRVRVHHLSGGQTLYIGDVSENDLILTSSNAIATVGVSPAFVSLMINRRGEATSLNVSSATGSPSVGDIMSLTFDHWSASLFGGGATHLRDVDFAPPPNVCFSGSGTGANCKAGPKLVTIDVYRTSDNDSYIKQLEQQNAADPVGECWFLSNFSPHPFITHFQVTMRDMDFTLYQECNGGQCACNVPSAPSNYGAIFSIMRGVGREEGVGGNVDTDGQHQCLVGREPSQGFWFSFQRAGLCGPSQAPGDLNCTYSYTRVKTISQTCAQTYINISDPVAKQGQQLVQAFARCRAQNI